MDALSNLRLSEIGKSRKFKKSVYLGILGWKWPNFEQMF